MRIGKRPSKSLFLMWAKRDLKRMKFCQVALDLACGNMYFRPILPAKIYIGVDVLRDRLKKGLSQYPDSLAICGKMENLSPKINADIVICFETIGINAWFNDRMTLDCIDKIIHSTKINGTILVNIGSRVSDLHSEIIKRIQNNFTSVTYKYYGRWHFQTFSILSLFLGYCMNFFPSLRTDRSTPWVYIVAQNKLL